MLWNRDESLIKEYEQVTSELGVKKEQKMIKWGKT